MKKCKHPYGYYKRPCRLQIKRIPGISNNNLRMYHIPTIRTRTTRRWINKHWEVELSARWANWKNKIDAFGLNRYHYEEEIE